MLQPECEVLQNKEYYSLLDSLAYSKEALEILRLRKLVQDSIRNAHVQKIHEGKTVAKSPPTNKNIQKQTNLKSVPSPGQTNSSSIIDRQSTRLQTSLILQRLHSAMVNSNAKNQIQQSSASYKPCPCAVPLALPVREKKVDTSVKEVLLPKVHTSSKIIENVSFVTYKELKKKELSITVLPSIDIEGTDRKLSQGNNSFIEMKDPECCVEVECLSRASSTSKLGDLYEVASTNTDNKTLLYENSSKVNTSINCEALNYQETGEIENYYSSTKEKRSKSTQANSLHFSKGVQVSVMHTPNEETSNVYKDVNVDDTKQPTIGNSSFCSNEQHKKFNYSQCQPESQDSHTPATSDELISFFKHVFGTYENYQNGKGFSSMNYNLQNESQPSVITRDVSIQLNPPPSYCKETMTSYVKMQHTSSQWDDCSLQSPERSSRTPIERYNAKNSLCEKAVMTVVNPVLHAETQVELEVLNASSQTSELQHQISVANTSVSSATVSDSEFVDDTLSEGEVRLPWNLRLLSSLDKSVTHMNSMLTSDGSSKCNWEQDDYSLSEGEIHPKCLAYYENLMQQNKLLTNSTKDDSSELVPEKLISTLQKHLSAFSKRTESDTIGSAECSRQFLCPSSFDSSLSEDEHGGRSLSPGEVFLNPRTQCSKSRHTISSSVFGSAEKKQSVAKSTGNVPSRSMMEYSLTAVTPENDVNCQSFSSPISYQHEDKELNIQNNPRNVSRTSLNTVCEE